MKPSSLFRLTATVILVQIALGGLVTFSFIGPEAHIGWGVVVGLVALFTLITAVRLKPMDRQLRGVSIGIIAALVVQVILGFSTMDLSSDLLAWIHLVLGVLIYAMALTGMSFAQRRERMTPSQVTPPPTA